MAYDNAKKRNTPVVTLIKNYINKKSGKVAESREEIQRRFDYLDWKEQKKIIRAFLDSGKTDRQWAYSKAIDYWDKSFEPQIKKLWEQHHEEKCSWAVIRHFPIEYLNQNIDIFTGNRDYYFICLRLAEDKDFVIDREKLSKTDYLAVLYHTRRDIETADAENLLYEIVHDICLDCDPLFALDRFADSSKGNIISPKSFQSVSLALYYLRKMGHVHLTWLFDEWNEKVLKAIFDSTDFKEVSVYEISDSEYRFRMIKIARKYAYLSLDDKYKKDTDPSIEEMLKPKEWYSIVQDEEWGKIKARQQTKEKEDSMDSEPVDPAVLKEMVAKNPALEKLVGSLGLDINNESEIPF